MNDDAFRRAWLLLPQYDHARARAVELWCIYYRSCDQFDGGPGPVPPERRAISARYAIDQREIAMRYAQEEGISYDTMMDARDEGLRLAEGFPNR